MAVRTFSGTAIGGGTASVPVRTGGYQSWVVQQISTSAPSAPIGSTCKIRRNGVIVVPFMVPTGDVASGEPPIDLSPVDQITVDWTGLVAGSAVEVTIIYEVA